MQIIVNNFFDLSNDIRGSRWSSYHWNNCDYTQWGIKAVVQHIEIGRKRRNIKYKSLLYSKSNFGDTKQTGKKNHLYRCRLLHIFNFTSQLGSRSVDCNIVITDYGIVGIARRSTFTQNDSGFLDFYISCKRYLDSLFAII